MNAGCLLQGQTDSFCFSIHAKMAHWKYRSLAQISLADVFCFVNATHIFCFDVVQNDKMSFKDWTGLYTICFWQFDAEAEMPDSETLSSAHNNNMIWSRPDSEVIKCSAVVHSVRVAVGNHTTWCNKQQCRPDKLLVSMSCQRQTHIPVTLTIDTACG